MARELDGDSQHREDAAADHPADGHGTGVPQPQQPTAAALMTLGPRMVRASP
jgi:hypothetical protein